MSLEAIRAVTEREKQMQEQKQGAEAEARAIIAEAEKAGLALMQHVQTEAAEYGKQLNAKAEEQAAKRYAEIQSAAERECEAMRELAGQHMEDAVEFIVGRVVNQ